MSKKKILYSLVCIIVLIVLSLVIYFSYKNNKEAYESKITIC